MRNCSPAVLHGRYHGDAGQREAHQHTGWARKKKKLILVKVYQTVPFRAADAGSGLGLLVTRSGLMPVQISRFLRVVYVGERERESEKSGERKSEEYRS